MVDGVVKSAGRVLEVFEYFAKHRNAATVNDICSALGYPQSSTSVLLKSLHTLGYLGYDLVSRQYFPSLRLALLGNWIEHGLGEFFERLKRLQQRTNASVLLVQQIGAEVQNVWVAPERSTGPIELTVGHRDSVVTAASGQVLLSVLPDPLAARILRQASRGAPGEARAPEDAALADIRRAREEGLCIRDGTPVPGFTSLSTLAPITFGGQVLAISVALPTESCLARREELIGAMRELAPPADVQRPSSHGVPAMEPSRDGLRP